MNWSRLINNHYSGLNFWNRWLRLWDSREKVFLSTNIESPLYMYVHAIYSVNYQHNRSSKFDTNILNYMASTSLIITFMYDGSATHCLSRIKLVTTIFSLPHLHNVKSVSVVVKSYGPKKKLLFLRWRLIFPKSKNWYFLIHLAHQEF